MTPKQVLNGVMSRIIFSGLKAMSIDQLEEMEFDLKESRNGCNLLQEIQGEIARRYREVNEC